MRRRVPAILVSAGHATESAGRRARVRLRARTTVYTFPPVAPLAAARVSRVDAMHPPRQPERSETAVQPSHATRTDAPDEPASPGGRRALWEALAGPAPPPPPAPTSEPEPEDSGLKFANTTPAAELLAPVFAALQVASLCPGASLDDAADFLSSQHGLVTVGQIRAAIGRGESVRPLHSLGRSLLKSSRLGACAPWLG